MQASHHSPYAKDVCYVLLSFTLWVAVEYVTVWHAKLAEWIALMPYVFIQYLAIIAVFWFVLARRRWPEKKTFFLMLVVMYVMEFLWQTPLLLNPLTFVPASLLLMSIWGFLTFLPWWLVQRTLREHRLHCVACLLWLPAGFVFAVLLG